MIPSKQGSKMPINEALSNITGLPSHSEVASKKLSLKLGVVQ